MYSIIYVSTKWKGNLHNRETCVISISNILQPYYDLLIDTPVEVRVGALEIAKPLLLWINDGLMAIFFFMVGLELKREFIEGELSDKKNIILPGFGAIGGMLVPALVYVYFNYDNKPTTTASETDYRIETSFKYEL